MTSSLRGAKCRAATAAAAVALILGLSACTDDSGTSEGTSPTATSASPTPDAAAEKAADEAAVVDLAARYWNAVVSSQNTGNGDSSQFSDVATPEVTEGLLAQVADYKKLDLLRVGQPAITDVEAEVNGDTAQILLCKDEDPWTAEVGGEAVEGEQKFGNGPWGARAQKIDGRWLVSEIQTIEDGAKSCA